MYCNLKAELARKSISFKEVSDYLGITEKTLRNKISGVTSFSVEEGLAIKNKYLPTLEFGYLFSRVTDQSA